MEKVKVYEVAPRDGLQNEQEVLPTEHKVEFIRRLIAAGYSDIEVSSFVRPRWIPQLADASDVVAALPRDTDVTFWALVPNRRGLERAMDAGMGAVATFMSASETHNLKNVNRTRRESLAGLREVIGLATAEGMRVRAYISTVFGCPYEGHVPAERTLELAGELLEAGAEQLSLGDTTGMGNPRQVIEVLSKLVDAGVPLDRIALHMHDTRGTALANILAGLQFGVRTFDASVAGLGGCPYAPGAAGNAASEDLIYMLESMGYDTGLDLDAVSDAGVFIEEALGRKLPGRYHQYHKGVAAKKRAQTA
ncbi:MAG: hydroxymethylglutaryl-CoA lyase [Alphaproteobacteria bacterium]|nr:hydroxymethylglutaryl-CoA lyase [Alphaproteobacteria bacterium]